MTQTFDLFGPVVTGEDVARAVRDHLKAWMPTYLAVMESHSGREPRSLPQPRSWITRKEFTKWPEDQTPIVLCTRLGLAGPPSSDGEGRQTADFQIGVAAICSSTSDAKSQALADDYFMALKLILAHHPSLGGFAAGCRQRSERYDPIPSALTDGDRTMAAGYGEYLVTVENVLASRAGLSEPPDDPYSFLDEWPTVTDTDLEVEKQ